ncbi:hypothetical protein AMTRI_Chr08g205240 [Amborella trichopoda]
MESYLENMDLEAIGEGKDRELTFSSYYKPHPRKAKELQSLQTLLLAYQSLGVMSIDIGTSPLYVFSFVSLSNPREKDILGVLSLIFWTVMMIGLLKYVFIVLHADDHGGGTFALYSLMNQHINFKNRISGGQTMRLDSADSNLKDYNGGSLSKAKKLLEKSLVARPFLTFIVLLSTYMVIDDGALTPTFSQSLFLPLIHNAFVVWINRCNRSLHYIHILSWVIQPHYIYYYFARNHKHRWEMLGAVILCITGAGIMFADMSHFNKQGIQIAFFCFVYLIKNPENISTTFYSFVPSPVFWLIFVYSPHMNYFLMLICILIIVGFKGGIEIGNALVMFVVWETNIMIICIFFLVFISIESIYMTFLFNKVPQGCWVPFVVSAFFLCKLSLLDLQQLASNLDVSRVPGVCFFSTNLINERFLIGKLAPKGVYRCLVQYGYMEHPSMKGDYNEELEVLETCKDRRVAFVMGRTILRTSKKTGWFQRLVIDRIYPFF